MSALPTDVTVKANGTEDGDYRFDQPVIQTVPGGTVTWECNGGAHTVTAYHAENDKPHRVPNGSAAFSSGKMSDGDTFSHTFQEQGVYNYFCGPHESNGMVGIVIVGDPAQVNEPGLMPPQSSLADGTVSALEEMVEDARIQLSLPIAADVSMRGNQGDQANEFSPEVVRIRRGGVIRFQSETGTHTATAYHPENGEPQRVPQKAAGWNTGTLEGGTSAMVSLTREGVHDYYCMPHEGDGMTGVVLVGNPDDLEAEPAMADFQSEIPDKAQDALSQQHDRVESLMEQGPTTTSNDTETDADTDTETDTATATPDGEVDVTVSADGTSFSPDLITIEAGDTVQWDIKGIQHSVTAYEDRIPTAASAFDSGMKQPGTTFTHTFTEEGVYDYYCIPHHSAGMVGTVIVGDPTSADQPGLSAPGSDVKAPDSMTDLNGRAKDELGLSATETPADGLMDVDLASGWLSAESNYSGPPDDKTGQDTVTIDVGASGNTGSYAFGPAAVYVDPGTTVKWEWTGDGGTHNVVAKDDSFKSGDPVSDSSTTFTQTFEDSGIYRYYCVPHKSLEMKGAIVVTGMDGTPTPTATPTETETFTEPSSPGSNLVTNNEFTPDLIEIQKGDTVTWNIEQGSHTITAYSTDNGRQQRIPDAASSFDSGVLGSGESFEHTFDTAGVYDYYCQPHESSSGMVGTVVVGTPGSSEPGLSTPADDIPTDATNKLESLNQKVMDQIGGGAGTGSTPVSTDTPTGGGGGGGVGSYLSGANGYDGSNTDMTGQTSVTINVGAGDGFAFDPAAVEIDKGTEVTWEGVGSGHNVVAESGDFDSGPYDSGPSTYSYTFESDATHFYYCSPHKSFDMKGAIVVGDGGDTSGGTPTPTPTPDLSGVSIDTSLPESEDVAIVQDDWPRFTPRVVHIRRGGTVTWHWKGDMKHSVTLNESRAPEEAVFFGSQLTTAPQTYEHKFYYEGVYQYFCALPDHTAMMKAVVIVGNPDPSDEPALTKEVDPSKPGARTLAELIYDTEEYLNGNQSLEEAAMDGHEPGSFETSVTRNYDLSSEDFDNVDTSLPDSQRITADSPFNPLIVHVRKGATVTWDFDATHSITAKRIPDGAAHFASDMKESGSVFKHTFNTEGVFEYYCINAGHIDDMWGMVIVGNPDPDNQPALEPLDSDDTHYEVREEVVKKTNMLFDGEAFLDDEGEWEEK